MEKHIVFSKNMFYHIFLQDIEKSRSVKSLPDFEKAHTFTRLLEGLQKSW